MNYFDCHADTLTEIVKPGDCLEENSGDLDLKRAGDFVENYTQIFAGKMRRNWTEKTLTRIS